MLMLSLFYKGRKRNQKTPTAYTHRIELKHQKFIELCLLNHLLSLNLEWSSSDAQSLYLQNILSPPDEHICNCGFFWPKEGAAEPTKWEFYVIWLAGLGATPSVMSRDVLLTADWRASTLTGRMGGERERLRESYRSKGETEVLWMFTFPFFCFLNIIVNEIKLEYSANEPKCVSFYSESSQTALSWLAVVFQARFSEAKQVCSHILSACKSLW